MVYKYKLTKSGIKCKEYSVVYETDDMIYCTEVNIDFRKKDLNTYSDGNIVLLDKRDDQEAQTIFIKHCMNEFMRQQEYLSNAQNDLYQLVQNQIDCIFENPVILIE